MESYFLFSNYFWPRCSGWKKLSREVITEYDYLWCVSLLALSLLLKAHVPFLCDNWAVLFTIAKTCKQQRCPSVGEWITKLRSIQIMEYYSALKRNVLLSNERAWRQFKNRFPSQRSQSERATYCMIPAIWHSGKGKTTETIERSVAARGWREGGMNRQSTEEF